mgnify:CR=1 FL=1
MIINNSASSTTGLGLSKNVDQMKSSLLKLASGSKINKSSDDAGGLAVSMKLDAAISRTYAVQSNVANAQSYLQTQNSVMGVAGNVLSRMSELAMSFKDPTKSASDKAAYQEEFSQLQSELQSLSGETFNGVSLFGSASGPNTVSVPTSEDGTSTADIQKAYVDDPSGQYAQVKDSGNSLSAGTVNVSMINRAIEELANLRAQNGASASRLQFASDTLSVNAQNLMSANSRITDTDVAEESTKLATFSLLAQSGTGMLAQANLMKATVMRLLG